LSGGDAAKGYKTGKDDAQYRFHKGLLLLESFYNCNHGRLYSREGLTINVEAMGSAKDSQAASFTGNGELLHRDYAGMLKVR
jgi:hypothetical protein